MNTLTTVPFVYNPYGGQQTPFRGTPQTEPPQKTYRFGEDTLTLAREGTRLEQHFPTDNQPKANAAIALTNEPQPGLRRHRRLPQALPGGGQPKRDQQRLLQRLLGPFATWLHWVGKTPFNPDAPRPIHVEARYHDWTI
ncbi:MAG: hypothetical protein SFZ03_06660 [Candidatus Melainabacteria bacterium]|nr:hypothetical protein [Candidatus Melainabacteria bacterium]